MKKKTDFNFAKPILRSLLHGLYSSVVTTNDDDIFFLRDSCPAILCVKLYSHLRYAAVAKSLFSMRKVRILCLLYGTVSRKHVFLPYLKVITVFRPPIVQNNNFNEKLSMPLGIGNWCFNWRKNASISPRVLRVNVQHCSVHLS